MNQIFASFLMALVFSSIGLPSIIHSAMLLTREDCVDLYSMVRGQQSENALDIFRRITNQGLDVDTIVRLYDYCLRSEEGIRYRRMAPSNTRQDTNEYNFFEVNSPNSMASLSFLYRKLRQQIEMAENHGSQQ